MTARLLAAAAAGFAAFAALGAWVVHHPLSRIDMLGVAARGANVPLALVFTNSGYGLPLSAIAALTFVGAFALRVPLATPLFIIIAQLSSQLAVNIVKGVFARSRPPAWIFRHELGFAYPSGHATTAVVFYGGWALVVWLSPASAPVRLTGATLLIVWALGIGWSRVALGAHYVTDVAGGYLFGLSWLALSVAAALSAKLGLAARLN